MLREINKVNKTLCLHVSLFDLEEAGNKQINNLIPYSLSSEDDVVGNKAGRETDWEEGINSHLK